MKLHRPVFLTSPWPQQRFVRFFQDEGEGKKSITTRNHPACFDGVLATDSRSRVTNTDAGSDHEQQSHQSSRALWRARSLPSRVSGSEVPTAAFTGVNSRLWIDAGEVRVWRFLKCDVIFITFDHQSHNHTGIKTRFCTLSFHRSGGESPVFKHHHRHFVPAYSTPWSL